MLEVTVNLKAIEHNFQFLKNVSGLEIMPVVKAEAYGHGMVEVARTLESAGAEKLAVGPLQEGLKLAEYIDPWKIYSLIGPVHDEDFARVPHLDLTCFIHCRHQLERLAAMVAPGLKVKVGLKFDTGMRRLGFKAEDAGALVDFFRTCRGLVPVMISSHLATADDPLSREDCARQSKSFKDVTELFQQAGFNLTSSLDNSAAILCASGIPGQIARPGVALYGSNPLAGTSLEHKGNGLRQAMQVTAPVLSVAGLSRGDRVSYGLTFKAPRDMLAAVVGCGYAHGYSRLLSNRSWMCFQGRRLPLIGRVCMQLSVLDVSSAPEIQPGDRVHVLGGDSHNRIKISELAGWWETIDYEVMCLLGKNSRTFVRE